MKHILIVIPSLKHGGTNRSLWNFLNTKTNENYAVDILAMEHNGPYKENFSKFNLLPENPLLASLFSPINAVGFAKVRKIFYKLLFKVAFRSNRQRLFKTVAHRTNISKYSTVVAFQEGWATEFVSYLPVDKRIAWIRCDYSNYLRLTKRTTEASIYNRFDRIVCVSNYTAGVFSAYYPHLSDRVLAIHNIIDDTGIIASSKNAICDERFSSDTFTLISVGRMDPVKRFTHIPGIAKQLKDSGCEFKWYIVGSCGTEELHVQQKIAQHSVEEQVIMLGSRDNPYPYIAAADVLVCPSSTEACPNVVNEAKILHIPVVVADFPSAPEYIEHGVNGEVVAIEHIKDSLLRLYEDSIYYEKLKENISSFVYDNEEIRQQLDKLFD